MRARSNAAKHSGRPGESGAQEQNGRVVDYRPWIPDCVGMNGIGGAADRRTRAGAK